MCLHTPLILLAKTLAIQFEKCEAQLLLSSITSHIHQSIVNILLSDLPFPLSSVTFLCSISMSLKSMTLRCDCIHFIRPECHFHPWKGDTMNSPRYFSPLSELERRRHTDVCAEEVRKGCRIPRGGLQKIQGNKNASIFGRAFVSPDS